MNVFFVGMPLKAIAGMALIALVLPLLSTFVGQMVVGMPHDLTYILRGMRQT